MNQYKINSQQLKNRSFSVQCRLSVISNVTECFTVKMEKALEEKIEELHRSRTDFSNLFQNFKQARSLFEVQKEQSEQLFEERDKANSLHLENARRENELLARKIFEQKCVIKGHKVARKVFEDDVNHLKNATELLEIRENRIAEKYDSASLQNTEYQNQIKLQFDQVKVQSDSILKLSAEIERLNYMISTETVPTSDLELRCLEIESLKAEINEMVSLETHQQVKEKYADLQCHVGETVNCNLNSNTKPVH